MMYDYALTELKKMKHSVALESPLYALKKSLEEDFRAIRDKKQQKIAHKKKLTLEKQQYEKNNNMKKWLKT